MPILITVANNPGLGDNQRAVFVEVHRVDTPQAEPPVCSTLIPPGHSDTFNINGRLSLNVRVAACSGGAGVGEACQAAANFSASAGVVGKKDTQWELTAEEVYGAAVRRHEAAHAKFKKLSEEVNQAAREKNKANDEVSEAADRLLAKHNPRGCDAASFGAI